MAYDGSGRAVGRIAAFYDREHAYSYEQPTGGCGFFEAIDDQQLADMMFDAARDWLAQRGMEAMDGPVNFGSRDAWWGLLVEGYEFQPLYENPYNPPYYKALFENYGFQNYFNQNTYIWKCYDDSINDVVYDRVKRLMSTPGYRFEPLGKGDLKTATENIRLIYNKAWALFTGVKPMSEQQAQDMMKMLRPIVDRDLIYFAYFNDEPIAFFVMVPDLNRIIGKFRGKLNLINKLRLMWDLKVRRRSDRIFAIIFGVTPEFQGKGVESGMMKYMLEKLRAHRPQPLPDHRVRMDRRLQPRHEPHGRALYLCPPPQGAHDIPLPVRPHQGVQALPVAGAQTQPLNRKTLKPITI